MFELLDPVWRVTDGQIVQMYELMDDLESQSVELWRYYLYKALLSVFVLISVLNKLYEQDW